MLLVVLVGLSLIGLLVQLVLLLAQRRLLGAAAATPPPVWPRVSVLKPLKGVDPNLEGNLESCFRLDYPDLAVVVGVDDPTDQALAVARRVAARHPSVRVAFTVATARRVPNPKVDNLVAMLPAARGELLLVSDSNVAVAPGLLRAMVAALDRPGVGLVTSPIRGTAPRGAWAAVEALQLNGFVMGGVAAASLARRVCAVGKSMLLRRFDLERIGGLELLGQHLAEDQVCGERIAGLGLATAVVAPPVDNVLGALSLRQVAGRHLRWARIRRRMAPVAYAAELLANPVSWSLAAALASPGKATALFALSVCGSAAAVAAAAEWRLGVTRPLPAYLLLEPLRQLLVTALWPLPWFDPHVTWRGRRYRVGPLTRVAPVGAGSLPEPASSGEEGWAADLAGQEAGG